MKRQITQLLIVAPIFLYAPFVLPFVVVPFNPYIWTEPNNGEEIYSGIVLALGAYGIIALILSIFLSRKTVKKRTWIQTTLIAFLAGGIFTAANMLYSMIPQKNEEFHDIWSLPIPIWAILGSAIVAAWNIWRYINNSNQAVLTIQEAARPES